jgi:hypothetical protein
MAFRIGTPYFFTQIMLLIFLEDLLPCAYKSLFGIDCPICGAQRSLLLLLQGKFVESLYMYFPLIPILSLIIIAPFRILQPRWISRKFLSRYSIAVLIIIMITYGAKFLFKI